MPIQLSDMVIFRGYHNLLWENLIILSNFLGICHTPLWEILSASFLGTMLQVLNTAYSGVDLNMVVSPRVKGG